MAIVRIQAGHAGRTTGSTGAYNSTFNVSEQDFNIALSSEIHRQVTDTPIPGLTFEFIDADEKPYSECDIFIALHMDGSVAPSARGWSIGYPTASPYHDLFKDRYRALAPPSEQRSDNYTAGLRGYYGYKSSYSGNAPTKMVLENGFITNETDMKWARQNRPMLAAMIVDTAIEYLDPEALVPLADGYKVIKTATGDEYSYYVHLWQERLNVWGNGAPIAEDGLVGPNTESAHRLWSKEHAVLTTSRPGKYQWRKILKDPDDVYVPPEEPTVPETPPEPEPDPCVALVEAAVVELVAENTELVSLANGWAAEADVANDTTRRLRGELTALQSSLDVANEIIRKAREVLNAE
jgi:hypothetical protein